MSFLSRRAFLPSSSLCLLVLAALVAPACIVVPGPVSAGGTTNGLEYGIDRPGYDYRDFDLSAADPVQCQNACFAEPQCQSFTYANPGVATANPHCWLKGGVAPAVPKGGCTSGVKGTYSAPPPQVVAVPPPLGVLENDTNRYGSDISYVDVPSADPAICQDACMREPACRAFSLVRPGIQGPSARCWLKNNVPPPRHDRCCVSGVK